MLQTGVAPPHWAFETQETQVPVAVKQTGVVPAHCAPFVAEHWPQEPFGWQAGAAPGHWESLAQAWQVWVAALQTGVVPPH